jgi:hypothetical protein
MHDDERLRMAFRDFTMNSILGMDHLSQRRSVQ